jgi:hypothetical protein
MTYLTPAKPPLRDCRWRNINLVTGVGQAPLSSIATFTTPCIPSDRYRTDPYKARQPVPGQGFSRARRGIHPG